jgi:DNA-damage-inducible protein J
MEAIMAATAMIHARVEPEVKEQASQALEKMGLTLSGAVSLFLARVAAEQAIPFEVRVPNAATRAAMAEADVIVDRRAARFAEAVKLVDALEAAGE